MHDSYKKIPNEIPSDKFLLPSSKFNNNKKKQTPQQTQKHTIEKQNNFILAELFLLW